MQLSDRFLKLVQQQLSTFDKDCSLECLIVYIAQAKDGQDPSLEAVGQWPSLEKALPPVEADPALRAPSSSRRWYPLQEGLILLGVLRAELRPSVDGWPEDLDEQLQASAGMITNFLKLELDRSRLLEELTQQREQISVMVHQLRNPLAALRTYAQLLMRRLEPDSRHLTLVESLLTEQAQLNRYLSALDQIPTSNLVINANRSDSLLLPPLLPQSKDLSLQDLLQPLIDRAAATANLQGRIWSGPSEWPLWTKEIRPSGDGVIAEIVANLLENAFRYSNSPCSIGLHLLENGLCVWDGGSPIPIEERQRIFDRGFRGERVKDVSGSGLGLSMGRQLAEQLGGSLDLLVTPSNIDPLLPAHGNAFLLKLPER